MAWSFACCTPSQNLLFGGKDKLAGGTCTKGNNCCTFASAATHASIPAVVCVIALLVPFGSANSFVVRYLEDDHLRIVRTIFEARPLLLSALVSVPAFVVSTALHYEGPRERPVKARFLHVYWGKTHIKCYNFFQQCKDHFGIAGTTGPNRVLFMATFLKNTALFRQQQY